MAVVPRTKEEVVALANTMITAFRDHAADFPGTDPDALEEKLGSYEGANSEAVAAQAQVDQSRAVLTYAKGDANDRYTEMLLELKSQLAIATNRVDQTPVETYLGITVETPYLILPPAAPELVEVTDKGSGSVYVNWKPSRSKVTGEVAAEAYIIEKNGVFHDITLMTQYTLTGLAIGTEVVIGVKASAAIGKSIASTQAITPA